MAFRSCRKSILSKQLLKQASGDLMIGENDRFSHLSLALSTPLHCLSKVTSS